MKYNLLKLSALGVIVSPAYAAVPNKISLNSGFHRNALLKVDGGHKRVSEIEVGEEVGSFCPPSEAMGRAKIVDKWFGKPELDVIEIDLGDRKIDMFPDQRPFDVHRDHFVRARDITTNNILFGEDGSPLPVFGVRRKRRASLSLPQDLTVNHADHTLFVDGVLCHNMDALVDFVGKEGIKRMIPSSVPGLELAALSAGVNMGKMVYDGIQRENEAIAKGEFVPVDRKTTFAELNGAWSAPVAAPAPVVEIKAAPAPQRKVDREKVAYFRQQVASKSHQGSACMVEPAPSGGRAPIQVPYYAHNDPNRAIFEGHDKNDMRTPEERMKERQKKRYEELRTSSDPLAGMIKMPPQEKEKTAKEKRSQWEKWEADEQERKRVWEEARDKRIAEEREKGLADQKMKNEQFSKSVENQKRYVGIYEPEKAAAQKNSAVVKVEPVEEKSVFVPQHRRATPEEIDKLTKMFDVRKTVPTPAIVRLPAHIGVHVTTKTHMEAAENIRGRSLQDLQRQLEAQNRYDSAMRSEQSQKSINSRRSDQAATQRGKVSEALRAKGFAKK